MEKCNWPARLSGSAKVGRRQLPRLGLSRFNDALAGRASCCSRHVGVCVTTIGCIIGVHNLDAEKRVMKNAKTRKLMGRHIVADPTICHGKPTFRGTRIMVWQVLDMVAQGWRGKRSFMSVITAFPRMLSQRQ